MPGYGRSALRSSNSATVNDCKRANLRIAALILKVAIDLKSRPLDVRFAFAAPQKFDSVQKAALGRDRKAPEGSVASDRAVPSASEPGHIGAQLEQRAQDDRQNNDRSA